MSLHVWAPNARQVEAEIAGTRSALQPAKSGWWQSETTVNHGTDYAFLLDGEGPFPDPRSPWQPEGVHGPSRHVDHERFVWNDCGWQAPPLASAVIEEIHIGTFTPAGTFDGAIARLDHLVNLGITHLELMPVAEFPGDRGWGYDGVDLYAPHHAYGGPEGLKRLVNACHRKGLAVLLDVVYNHLGPDGNYLARFGPYFTGAYSTPWGEAVNLDQANSDQVRDFLIGNALMWLRDYHIDGLRLDAVHAIVDTSAMPFLEQLRRAVQALEAQLGRHLVLIAENDLNDPRLIRPPEAGGFGLNAMWNEDFHHALHALLTGERRGYYQDFGALADVSTALTSALVYDGRYSQYRQQRHGRPATGLPGRRFVGFLQNHDQIGNRPQGERSAQLLSEGLLHIGAALVMTAPFVPLLFQGEEWAASTPFQYFTDHQEPLLAEKVRKGRRNDFGAASTGAESVPDPQDPDTFKRCRLNWQEQEHQPHTRLLAWHKALARLRRTIPALTDDCLDNIRVDFDETARWLLLQRSTVTIVCNLAGTEQRIHHRHLQLQQLVLASQTGVALENENILLPAESVAILM
ncbi:malto-oligosyltrehalose trehalohydrolase [Marinobacter sp.]|uniref:malto-oligosyltrehalose trehalohydrolase n=1 Tax=Marinobacter sp. TaxID=50741 RepID=UPI002B496B08|nr:malto-oligosyltrehalose trehalohydrolase [Marinobacter sp.]HKK54683.1 malto-oligosyltrehalose trehalohydrolase [Marinobacter sp.]